MEDYTVQISIYDLISSLPEDEQLAVYRKVALFYEDRENDIQFNSPYQLEVWEIIYTDLLPKLKRGNDKPKWKKDFNLYLAECTEAYNELSKDKAFFAEKEKYYPNLNISLTLDKAYRTYWATHDGWRKKKASRIKVIDWKKTFSNAFNLRCNHVYKSFHLENFPTEPLCKWVNIRTKEERESTYKQYELDIQRYGTENIKFIGYVE